MKPSVLPHTCFINPRLNWVIFLLRILKSNQSQISEAQAHYKLFASFLIMRAFCKPRSAALLERGWLCQTRTHCFQSLAELITRVHGSNEVFGQIRCLLLPVGRGKCNYSGKWAWEILEDQHAPCPVSGRKNFLVVSLFDGWGNSPTQILFLVSGYRARLGDSFKFNSSAKNWASKLESCHGGKEKVELLGKNFSLFRFNISAVLDFKVPGIIVMCINCGSGLMLVS